MEKKIFLMSPRSISYLLPLLFFVLFTGCEKESMPETVESSVDLQTKAHKPAGSKTSTFYGPAEPFNGGVVRTMVTMSRDGVPVEIGIQHPSYPATSTGVTGAALEVLKDYFGSDYAVADATQENLYGVIYYDSFDDMLAAAALSRTHSGINYQLSIDVGEEMAKEVAELHDQIEFKK